MKSLFKRTLAAASSSVLILTQIASAAANVNISAADTAALSDASGNLVVDKEMVLNVPIPKENPEIATREGREQPSDWADKLNTKLTASPEKTVSKHLQSIRNRVKKMYDNYSKKSVKVSNNLTAADVQALLDCIGDTTVTVSPDGTAVATADVQDMMPTLAVILEDNLKRANNNRIADDAGVDFKIDWSQVQISGNITVTAEVDYMSKTVTYKTTFTDEKGKKYVDDEIENYALAKVEEVRNVILSAAAATGGPVEQFNQLINDKFDKAVRYDGYVRALVEAGKNISVSGDDIDTVYADYLAAVDAAIESSGVPAKLVNRAENAIDKRQPDTATGALDSERVNNWVTKTINAFNESYGATATINLSTADVKAIANDGYDWDIQINGYNASVDFKIADDQHDDLLAAIHTSLDSIYAAEGKRIVDVVSHKEVSASADTNYGTSGTLYYDVIRVIDEIIVEDIEITTTTTTDVTTSSGETTTTTDGTTSSGETTTTTDGTTTITDVSTTTTDRTTSSGETTTTTTDRTTSSGETTTTTTDGTTTITDVSTTTTDRTTSSGETTTTTKVTTTSSGETTTTTKVTTTSSTNVTTTTSSGETTTTTKVTTTSSTDVTTTTSSGGTTTTTDGTTSSGETTTTTDGTTSSGETTTTTDNTSTTETTTTTDTTSTTETTTTTYATYVSFEVQGLKNKNLVYWSEETCAFDLSELSVNLHFVVGGVDQPTVIDVTSAFKADAQNASELTLGQNLGYDYVPVYISLVDEAAIQQVIIDNGFGTELIEQEGLYNGKQIDKINVHLTLRGDADLNGIIDAMDAQNTIEYFSETMNLGFYAEDVFADPTSAYLYTLGDTKEHMFQFSHYACDSFDGNGEITAMDAQCILNYFMQNSVLQLPSEWDSEDVAGITATAGEAPFCDLHSAPLGRDEHIISTDGWALVPAEDTPAENTEG